MFVCMVILLCGVVVGFIYFVKECFMFDCFSYCGLCVLVVIFVMLCGVVFGVFVVLVE